MSHKSLRVLSTMFLAAAASLAVGVSPAFACHQATGWCCTSDTWCCYFKNDVLLNCAGDPSAS